MMHLFLFVLLLTVSTMNAQDPTTTLGPDAPDEPILYDEPGGSRLNDTGFNETGDSNTSFIITDFSGTVYDESGGLHTIYGTVYNDTDGSYTFDGTVYNNTDSLYTLSGTIYNDTGGSYTLNGTVYNDTSGLFTFNGTVNTVTDGSYTFDCTVYNETKGLYTFNGTVYNNTGGLFTINGTVYNKTGNKNKFKDSGFTYTDTSADTVSYSDLTDMFTTALSAFDAKQTLIPQEYTNQTMNVTIDLNLASLNSFDELGGYLEISGYLDVWWTATSVASSTADISVLLTSPKIWKPPLLLMNSVKGTAEIGDTTSTIRCNLMSWECVWKPWIVLRAACTPDVRYYPFDRQECAFKIAAWDHTQDELKLGSSRSDWNLDLFEENAEWTIVGTSSQNYNQHNTSFVEFQIKLRRIPMYYVINLIAPITLLALVNIAVFIMPVESGERVGFSMTCFLSFVFLLTSIMVFIPSSSINLAYLCYYTFIMMVFSCGIALATILTLWIHFKSLDSNNKVPFVLYGMVYMLKCQCFCLDTSQPDQGYSNANNGSNDVEGDRKYKVSWKEVASIMDIFFSLGFLGAEIFYSVAYLLPIILNE